MMGYGYNASLPECTNRNTMYYFWLEWPTYFCLSFTPNLLVFFY